MTEHCRMHWKGMVQTVDQMETIYQERGFAIGHG